MNLRGYVLQSAISNYLGKGVDLLTWLLLTPFILGHVGAAGFGLWTLVSSVIGYSSLLELGATNAIIKYVAEYHVHREASRVRPLLATALGVYVALGALIIVISIGLAPVLAVVLAVPEDARPTVTWLTLLMGVTAGLALPSTTFMAALQGLRLYTITNILSSIWTLSSAVATVVVLSTGGGVVGMVAVNIPITICMLLLSGAAVIRVDPALRLRLRDASAGLIRPIASYSWSVFVTNVAWRLEVKTDELVIGALLSVAAVTPYSLARRLAEAALILTEQFRRLLLPLASEMHIADDREQLRFLYMVGTRVTLALYIPIGGTLVLLAGPILSVWVGDEYAGQAYLVAILTAASLVMTAQKPGISVLQGIARHRPIAWMAVCSGVFNLVLSVALAPRLGLLGVAVGTLVPTLLVYTLLTFRYIIRTLDVELGAVLRQVLMPVVVPAIPLASVILVLRQLLGTASPIGLILVAAAGLLTYAGVYLAIDSAEVERGLLRSLAHDALRMAGW